MTPTPTRRRAECPVCGRVFLVRLDGLLRKHFVPCALYAHHSTDCEDWGVLCAGAYVDCTSEGTAT